MKVSLNKGWLAYIQELRKLPEKEEDKEIITYDLVIKNLNFAQEQDDGSDEDDEYGS